MTTSAKTLAELPAELRDRVQRFVTAASLIELDADGVPCCPDQDFEWDHLTDNADYLFAVLRSPVDTPLGSVRHLAWQWQCVVAAFRHGGATESNRQIMGRRWLAARAQVADLLPSVGVQVPDAVTPDLIESLRSGAGDDGPPAPERDFEELPLDSPEVQKMITEDPALLGFIGQALVADVEPPESP